MLTADHGLAQARPPLCSTAAAPLGTVGVDSISAAVVPWLAAARRRTAWGARRPGAFTSSLMKANQADDSSSTS